MDSGRPLAVVEREIIVAAMYWIVGARVYPLLSLADFRGYSDALYAACKDHPDFEGVIRKVAAEHGGFANPAIARANPARVPEDLQWPPKAAPAPTLFDDDEAPPVT